MKISLAPILGITNYHYRGIFNSLAGYVDYYYAPFVSTVNASKIKLSLLKDLTHRESSRGATIPQILGNNPQDFVRMAEAIFALGYEEINWNIGCPFPTVAGKIKGAGLLTYHERIESFLDFVFSNLPHRKISVKMRLGMYDVADYKKVIPVLNKFPLSKLILHGRTGSRHIVAFMPVMQDAFSLSQHVNVYNGDIKTLSDFQKVIALFPELDEFMIGRGAIAAPWLPAEIKGEKFSDSEKIALIEAMHRELFCALGNNLSGNRHILDKMKGYWMYFAVHLTRGDEFLKAIKQAKDSMELSRIVAVYFSTVPKIINSEPFYFFGEN